MNRYTVNEQLVEPFEIENATIIRTNNSSGISDWIAVVVVLLFGVTIAGATIVSIQQGNSDLASQLLDSTSIPLGAVFGYLYGRGKS